MKPTTFGNKKALQILSNEIKDNIKSNIKNMSHLEISSRYYNFLNEKNMHTLKEGDYKVSVNTFGHKYFLFLTKIDDKRYSIFINKKREDMIYIRFRFEETLYENTLFDGELIKNNKNEWIYVINELILYKGDNVLKTKKASERYNLVKTIFSEQFTRDDIMDVCKIDIKDTFSLDYLQDFYDVYIKSVPYKISGIYIQNENDHKKNFVYIFPECRSKDEDKNDHKSDGCLSKISTPASPKKRGETNTSNNKVVEQKSEPIEPIKESIKDDIEQRKEPTYFKVKITDLPDVYELYCFNKIGKEIRYGYAGVPNLETSQLLSNLFKEEKDKQLGIIMKCEYSQQFSKWIPIEMSTTNKIYKIL